MVTPISTIVNDRHEAKIFSNNPKKAHLLPTIVQTVMAEVGLSGALLFTFRMFLELQLNAYPRAEKLTPNFTIGPYNLEQPGVIPILAYSWPRGQAGR